MDSNQKGLDITGIMNGRGEFRRARAGAEALSRPELPPWSYLIAVSAPRRWLRFNHRKDRRGGREADAGAVFYQIGATGINAVQHYQEQARAASGISRSHWRALAESVTKTESTLCSARGG